MGLKRRTFLQQAGTALAALGLSEAGLSLLADRYQQALAQPTRRKLAVLVGINQYPESVCDYAPVRGTALNGCLTDVELQQELLIHRFGFQPSDIVTLVDQAATRQGIEAALLTMAEQSAAGDLVLFHFSGLGSQIRLEGTESQFQNSLVPIDGTLPTPESPVIHDLMQDTLGLLLRSFSTDQVITVLDAGYSRLGRTIQGNLRIRSRPDAPMGSIDPAELALQEQLTQRTSQPQMNQQQRQSGQLPGIVLQASETNRIATETQWNGFSAGLFTYALTQQLWWSTPATTLWVHFNQAAGAVKQAAGMEQQPAINGRTAQKQTVPVSSGDSTGADGVIRAIEEDGKALLWLAGLPAAVLENVGASLFSIAASTEAPKLLLQMRTRDGLTVKTRGVGAEAIQALHAGQLVQEAVRILPRNIGLTVALDSSLERIERVDATSAFSAIPRVSSVIAGEQPADFLFGKTQPISLLAASLPASTSDIVQDVPASSESSPDNSTYSGYGLFYPGRNAIPNTLIQNAEAVKTAINRLTPQLKTLLAIKLVRLTQNQGSSCLGVRASLEIVAPQERLILQQETVRASQKLQVSKIATLLLAEGLATLPVGSQIHYRLYNYSDQPVYFMLIGLDTKGNALIFHPAGLPASGELSTVPTNLIPPGATMIVPESSAANWLVQNPVGLIETHVICSRAPFTQTAQILEAEMPSKTNAGQITALLNPLEVVQAILQDLHQASSVALPSVEIPSDSYALDVNAWATLSFIYQVVES